MIKFATVFAKGSSKIKLVSNSVSSTITNLQNIDWTRVLEYGC